MTSMLCLLSFVSVVFLMSFKRHASAAALVLKCAAAPTAVVCTARNLPQAFQIVSSLLDLFEFEAVH